jgi:hypothetical protein
MNRHSVCLSLAGEKLFGNRVLKGGFERERGNARLLGFFTRHLQFSFVICVEARRFGSAV